MFRTALHSLRLLFCPPLRLQWVQYAALGLSAASAYMGYSGSKDTEKARTDAAEHEAALAKQQHKLQTEGIAAAREEAAHRAATDLHDTTVAFLQQRASVLAGAGEAGVAGGSVTRTLTDKTRQEQDIRGRELYALEVFSEQTARDQRATDLGLSGQVTGYNGVSDASLAISSGLGFAADALKIIKST